MPRLFYRLIKTPATGQEMICQKMEHLAHVVYTAKVEIVINIVNNRNGHITVSG